RARESEGGTAKSKKDSHHQNISSGKRSCYSKGQQASPCSLQDVGCVPVHPGMHSSYRMDMAECTCAVGLCHWDCQEGMDGCLSDTSCLWFQLLARAYWGNVDLGLRESQKGMSWRKVKKMSQKNCMRARAKQKDGCERSEASALSPAAEEEPFSWPGPKTLHLRRTSLGFGFTLRHFIVYPPESAVQSSLKDEDCSGRGRQRNRLEPMDTIFVKQVKEGGPAHGAGLCTDAYLKGNEAYCGNAKNIPEPPPICYPRLEANVLAMAQLSEPPRSAETSCGDQCNKPGSPPDPAQCSQVPQTQTVVRVFNENIRTIVASPTSTAPHVTWAGPNHRTDDNQNASSKDSSSKRSKANVNSSPIGMDQSQQSPRTAELIGFPNNTCTDTTSTPCNRHTLTTAAAAAEPFPSATSPSPYTPSPPAATPSPCSPLQNIDWRNYTTYKDYIDNKRLYMYGSRTIQERLDSLRAASPS
ncbi:hypothetical protein DNTS_006376, partial [Danionella cerebrum]